MREPANTTATIKKRITSVALAVDAGGFFAIDFKRAAYHVHPHTYNTRLRYICGT